MSPKLHPDDVPRELNDLSKYLQEVYSIEASAWVRGDLARAKLVPATKVRGRWRTTATAYLTAMSPKAEVA